MQPSTTAFDYGLEIQAKVIDDGWGRINTGNTEINTTRENLRLVA